MRLIAVFVGLCLLSCAGVKHADFSKRKYLDLRKFSVKEENCVVENNSFLKEDNATQWNDSAQMTPVLHKADALPFREEETHSEEKTLVIEKRIDQPVFEFSDTNKVESVIHEVVKNPYVISDNPDLDAFNKRAKLSFWLILAGLAAAILSVAIVLEGSTVLYIIVVVFAAACLLTGFILSIKNAALAKKIPEEDKTGLFQLKKFFAWLVSVAGVLILGGLLGYLIFELFW